MAEKDHLLRFSVRTLPANGGVQRSAMLVGGTPFSYGSAIDDVSDSPAVTRHPIQAENDGDMERVLILPVFKGEGGLPNLGIEPINSSYVPAIYKGQQAESDVKDSGPNKAFIQGKMVGKWHCFVFGVLLLATIVSVSLACAFGIIEVIPGTLQQDSPIYNGDTVLLSVVNTFWYDEVVVRKAKAYIADDHQVHLCSVLCDRLIPNQRFYHFKSSSRHANENVIILEPTYFVSNSVVNITVTVSNVSSPSITLELYIFDNVSNYYPFKDKMTKPSDTIAHKVVMTAGSNPVTTEVLFTIPQTSYYFFGLNTSASLTFQYSYEYLQMFYNYSDYTPTDCTLQDNSNECSLSLLPNARINAPQTCILGYTTTPIEFGASPIYLTTELHRSLWNPLTITLLALSAVAWLITCSLCLCYCVRVYKSK